MIIVKISGGLGNQLFQYALAKSLEQKRKIQIKIDVGTFRLATKTITSREFLLDKFNITLQTANKKDFHGIGVPYANDRSLKENIYRVTFKIREFLRPLNRKKIITEHRLDFNPAIFGVPDNSYISGNWTNQKYFSGSKEIILKEASLRAGLGEKARELLLKISGSNSTSIHVRRGDYLKYAHKYVILGEDYYRQAVLVMKEKIKNPLFFVFSDDIGYVKENYAGILGADAIYVSGKNIADYEELLLMSRCKNNIIANSTFSWWGAWLNQNQEKVVIAPKQYRNDGKDLSGFFPDEWVII